MLIRECEHAELGEAITKKKLADNSLQIFEICKYGGRRGITTHTALIKINQIK